jgi:ArsR family transcriptional regulator, arsenate/arsenite/antimonite-responsive transcriptional repressor
MQEQPDFESIWRALKDEEMGLQELAEAFAALFRALGKDSRVRIVLELARVGDEGACVTDFIGPLGIKQTSVSYHFRVLREWGLVTRKREGVRVRYRLKPELMKLFSNAVSRAFTPATTR